MPIRVVVSQISPPIRIVILCAVAFLGTYMLFLRPKEEAIPAPVPVPNVESGEPAVSAPGKAAEAAQEAVDATNTQLQAQEGVDGVDSTESAAGTAETVAANTKAPEGSAAAAGTIPADLKGVPAPVKKAIKDGKVLTLLFWNKKSADDLAVRAALRDVNPWNGRVHVQVANIQGISKWGRISRGVKVEQSPTVVVVDPELNAEALVGYVDAKTIDQAVADALRNTTGLFERRYLAEINAACAKYAGPIFAVPTADVAAPEKATVYLEQGRAAYRGLYNDFKAVKAPKSLRAFKAAAVRDGAAHMAILADSAAYLGAKPSGARLIAAHDRYAPRETKAIQSWDRRMDARNVVSCGKSM